MYMSHLLSAWMYVCVCVRMIADMRVCMNMSGLLSEENYGQHPLHLACKTVGLARIITIRCIYGIFGRETTKYTVICGVYTILANLHASAGGLDAYTLSRSKHAFLSFTHLYYVGPLTHLLFCSALKCFHVVAMLFPCTKSERPSLRCECPCTCLELVQHGAACMLVKNMFSSIARWFPFAGSTRFYFHRKYAFLFSQGVSVFLHQENNSIQNTSMYRTFSISYRINNVFCPQG